MTKIIQRHDTAENWTSVNPVLAAGEIGVEYGEPKYKFPDEATIHNTVTIDSNGNATFGSDNGYISFDSLSVPLTEIMEYTVAFTTGNSISSQQDIIRCNLGNIDIRDGYLCAYTGSSYPTILNLSSNKYYRIRVVSNQKTLTRIIYNDITKEQLFTYSPFPTYETLTLLQIGSTNIRTNRFLGTIHLSEFSFLGKLIFEEYTATKFKIGDGTTDWRNLTYSTSNLKQDLKTFTGYSDTGTLVLKSINGVLQWVAET